MSLPATMNLPTGERISAKGSRPCATALLERIVSTITPRAMKTSGTQIETSALSANTIHSVSSTIRSPAMSNNAPNKLVSPRLRATYPSSASDTKIRMIRKKLKNCHGVGCWYMSQTTMKSSSSRLNVTRFAIGGLYEWLRDPKPRGRPPKRHMYTGPEISKEIAMKYYDYLNAPSPRKVRLFIAEKGLDIPTQQVNLRSREQFRPEFLTKNPSGGVPLLELDDGTCLSESLAICHYLEQRFPQPNLMGLDAR